MKEENKKVIEDLLNINPMDMSYDQLVSMQNGWWETLNLLSEQNKENRQLKEQLQQKENIIKELKERSLQYSEEIDRLLDIKENVRKYIYYYGITPEENDNMLVRYILKGILEILDKENNNGN